MSGESLLISVLLALVLAGLLYWRRSAGAPGRRLWRSRDGSVIAIGERQDAAPGRWSGSGSDMSKPLQLTPGQYRMDYQFAALTRVALIDASGDETLFIKGGAGTEAFRIPQFGSYRLLVEPAEETATWTLEYRHTGK